MFTTTHTPGSAFLTFTRNGSDTVLTRAFATSPIKLITTRGRSSTCWVYAATFGGGLVGGDDIQLRADVASGARALLTTQASTKVYRSSRQSRQSIDAAVAADALLAVVPDPIVCFAGANFVQTQRYELHERSTLVMVDWMTSGRHATGERWAFSRYESRIDIRRGAQRIFLDGLVLERERDSVAERMGGVDVLLTAVFTGPLVADAAFEIIERVSKDPISRGSHLVASAARLRDGGALLRMAGRSVEQIGGELRRWLTFLPMDDFWNRKW